MARSWAMKKPQPRFAHEPLELARESTFVAEKSQILPLRLWLEVGQTWTTSQGCVPGATRFAPHLEQGSTSAAARFAPDRVHLGQGSILAAGGTSKLTNWKAYVGQQRP